MPALVPELVNIASDPLVSTTDLLRRSYVVARRLSVPELVDWINSELNGYGDADEVPDYRRIRGQLVALNRANSAIPFLMPSEMSDQLTELPVIQSIPELVQLKQSDRTNLYRYFPAEIEQMLLVIIRKSSGFDMRPALQISSVQIEGVIETVRSRVLDWALDLEEQGIIGDGMSFTSQEKQAVQEHYHFNNVSGSQIQIGSNQSTQKQANTIGTDIDALQGLIAALSSALDRHTIQEDAAAELRAELATLKAQAGSPKPKWEVIRGTARSIKAVLEGAAGNIMSELAKPHVQTLMALAGSTL